MAGELWRYYDYKELPCPARRKPGRPEMTARAQYQRPACRTIDDDGFVVRSRWRINCYCAKKKHKSRQYPADPNTRRLCCSGAVGDDTRIDRQIVNTAGIPDLPEAERKPAIAEEAWKEIVPAFGAGKRAAKSAWLAGPAFSVADLNVDAALYRALTLDLAKWPHLQAWLNRCWERPAAKRARAMREAK